MYFLFFVRNYNSNTTTIITCLTAQLTNINLEDILMNFNAKLLNENVLLNLKTVNNERIYENL